MGAAREGERRGMKGARASSRGGPEGLWAARRMEETVLIKSSACWPSGGRKYGSFSIRVVRVPRVCGSEAWRPTAEGNRKRRDDWRQLINYRTHNLEIGLIIGINGPIPAQYSAAQLTKNISSLYTI